MADILSQLAERSGKMPWFQLLLSFATVFVGLICIVIICKIVGAFCKGAARKEAEQPAPQLKQAETNQPENRAEIIAAVTAVCAEQMGKSVKGLRVVSFKKL